ncbi:hypothetical protein KATP_12910 [Kluyvera ascorbata]|nr:hypothetical protein KATP_12910 [Kluyvera ascorbata]
MSFIKVNDLTKPAAMLYTTDKTSIGKKKTNFNHFTHENSDLIYVKEKSDG